MQIKGVAMPSVVDRIVCDRCGKEGHRTEPDFEQISSIGFNAGRGSIFGYESRVEIDLCETCLRATLGTWLRVRTPWEIGKMPQRDPTLSVAQPQASSDQDRGRFAHTYRVLAVEEIAERLKCSTDEVREREAAGEIFAARAAAREGGPLFPAFQLDERLNKALLRQLIQEYRKWGASTTLMWSFLRSPQKIFGGLTPVEMLLGGSMPGYDELTPDEWVEAFLEVVSEELSRVTQ